MLCLEEIGVDKKDIKQAVEQVMCRKGKVEKGHFSVV
jgi:hypothetical protein